MDKPAVFLKLVVGQSEDAAVCATLPAGNGVPVKIDLDELHRSPSPEYFNGFLFLDFHFVRKNFDVS